MKGGKKESPRVCTGVHRGLSFPMTIKDKLMIYIYRKMCSLEDEKKALQKQLRFQPMDSLDIYEHMRNEIRIDAWNEFVSELFDIVLNCK